ncbi:MBL fold metallo-hydrolase [Methanococcus voltae]|uniref:7, 8-dihydropterin-6-yl-methyl-4-(Beta-D-ribofuranosyl)aminobenzene 5'-phosphate synthase n=2 Tax=Methanococcus voltae TaxID=2188 RepID=A0A8J7RFT8_METVO|nr:MBL fold metallo-hydrolase [Methanococcus voltae]MBP2171978.1 7,8-dihydropterin-6-yl-methyl-4-(beta-D-ribofuranosyl)aminobenzene 5'-phosphate synthase [Methanococcus voltae]MBP2201067.1 7,8-dihydropterin-6-yl-methyl-4-(beta-D-ribofuranosyl)aminobenzene 5'-phosphate synthase [Methanococcus voltae]MCS3921790.1 7,8-dihydropterin-6-yl-methyl-4-(beta-D-ribofuranosyl)aminobenzene 5'-phosphate synthase [Methanococcus voltae PS]
MKLTVLVDNNAQLLSRDICGEHGLSQFIEVDDKQILHDTGFSDLFIENAEELGINIANIDYLVLSHGHNDHTGGLKYLIEYMSEFRTKKQKPVLIAHDAVFDRKFKGSEEIGCTVDIKDIKKAFNVQLSKKMQKITENFYFLGEIERNNDFETVDPYKKLVKDENGNNVYVDDYLVDDSSLAYIKGDDDKKELVIITGCAHSGICNTTEMAKKLIGDYPVSSAIGGFHLIEPSEDRITKTCDYLKSLNLQSLYACHCTDLNSKIRLAQENPLKELSAGTVLEF